MRRGCRWMCDKLARKLPLGLASRTYISVRASLSARTQPIQAATNAAARHLGARLVTLEHSLDMKSSLPISVRNCVARANHVARWSRSLNGRRRRADPRGYHVTNHLETFEAASLAPTESPTTILPTTILPTTILPTTILPTTILPTTILPRRSDSSS